MSLLKEAVKFRKVEIPKPPILAACRNCAHFAYDADDRMGARGLYLEKTKKRCALNRFSTTSNSVCDKHEFKHLDKRDV
jgi:hypothetical protein